MALWPITAWTWRDIPDLWEYLSAVAGVGFSAWAALAAQGEKTWPAILAGLMGLSTLTAKFVSKRLEQRAKEKKETETRTQVKRIVSVILEEMRQAYFAAEADEERHKHRITLFVCVTADARSGKKKHLAIFARAGVFLDSYCTWALDDNHPDGCRGIAGKIWYYDTTLVKIADCDWPVDDDPLQKARYAQSLDIAVHEVEALNVKSRAFAGATVQVGGRKWGVLLVDSLKVGFIADNPYKKGLLNRYTELIGGILTEAGT